MTWTAPPGERAGSDTQARDRTSTVILTYHKIGSHLELGLTTVRRRAFAGHLDLLLGLGFDFVSAGDAVACSRGKSLVAVTFDDGYESVFHEAFPEMLQRGITGTVFPVVGAMGAYNTWDVNLAPRRVRHLSWGQLRGLAEAGFAIGSHTLTHRDLTRLDDRTLVRELHDSKKMVEDAIGMDVRAISYPFGRYSRRVIDEAVAAGYTSGFTSFPVPGPEPMARGRWAVYSIDGRRSLERKMGSRPGRWLERLKNVVIARLSLGTTLVKK
jgi:peptidoglycan/xylan/chitin deacetylase (PgdA/CDA1 family)